MELIKLLDHSLQQELLERFDHVSIQETLRFLYLVSKNGGGFISISNELDEIWHYLILQTKEYNDLCSRLPGKRFINHRSLPLISYIQKKDEKTYIEEGLKRLKEYNHEFGGFNENNYFHWGMAKFLIENKGLSIKSINNMR